jgi:hypothetical protein
MCTSSSIKLLISTLILLISFKGFSQVDNARTKAVLVQLKSENRRMQAMYAAKDYRQLHQLTSDVKEVASVTIKDFEQDFKYCPVYYYMDTNLQHIKERKFDGVLFDADGQIITKPVISPADTDYLIVLYGYPAVQEPGTQKVSDSAKYKVGNGEPFGRGLVIHNYKLEQVNYLYKVTLDEGKFFFTRMFQKRSKRNNNFYFSKQHGLEYMPFAKQFSERLTEKNGNPVFLNRRR